MIAGLDLSTTRIGYADPSGSTHSITTSVKPKEPARRLHELVRSLEHLLRGLGPRPRLVVIEGYVPSARGLRTLIRLAELGGVVRLRLWELDIAYVEVNPAKLKRYATGSGGADKPAMQAAAAELGASAANHDEADAFLLRHLGRAAYGLEAVEPDGYRAEVVASITWPDIEGASA